MARDSDAAVLLYLIKSPELRYSGWLNYKRVIQRYSDRASVEAPRRRNLSCGLRNLHVTSAALHLINSPLPSLTCIVSVS